MPAKQLVQLDEDAEDEVGSKRKRRDDGGSQKRRKGAAGSNEESDSDEAPASEGARLASVGRAFHAQLRSQCSERNETWPRWFVFFWFFE